MGTRSRGAESRRGRRRARGAGAGGRGGCVVCETARACRRRVLAEDAQRARRACRRSAASGASRGGPAWRTRAVLESRPTRRRDGLRARPGCADERRRSSLRAQLAEELGRSSFRARGSSPRRARRGAGRGRSWISVFATERPVGTALREALARVLGARDEVGQGRGRGRRAAGAASAREAVGAARRSRGTRGPSGSS